MLLLSVRVFFEKKKSIDRSIPFRLSNEQERKKGSRWGIFEREKIARIGWSVRDEKPSSKRTIRSKNGQKVRDGIFRVERVRCLNSIAFGGCFKSTTSFRGINNLPGENLRKTSINARRRETRVKAHLAKELHLSRGLPPGNRWEAQGPKVKIADELHHRRCCCCCVFSFQRN